MRQVPLQKYLERILLHQRQIPPAAVVFVAAVAAVVDSARRQEGGCCSRTPQNQPLWNRAVPRIAAVVGAPMPEDSTAPHMHVRCRGFAALEMPAVAGAEHDAVVVNFPPHDLEEVHLNPARLDVGLPGLLVQVGAHEVVQEMTDDHESWDPPAVVRMTVVGDVSHSSQEWHMVGAAVVAVGTAVVDLPRELLDA